MKLSGTRKAEQHRTTFLARVSPEIVSADITPPPPVVNKSAQHWMIKLNLLVKWNLPGNPTADMAYWKTSTVSGHVYKKLHVLTTTHKHWSFYYSEPHFTLITGHQHGVISVTISEIIDCRDNISTGLNEHIVLSIKLLLWLSCGCLCGCVFGCVCGCLNPWTITLYTVTGSSRWPEQGWHILGRYWIVPAPLHTSLLVWLWTFDFYTNLLKSYYG